MRRSLRAPTSTFPAGPISEVPLLVIDDDRTLHLHPLNRYSKVAYTSRTAGTPASPAMAKPPPRYRDGRQLLG